MGDGVKMASMEDECEVWIEEREESDDYIRGWRFAIFMPLTIEDWEPPFNQYDVYCVRSRHEPLGCPTNWVLV